jgi:hypothetical protein
MRTIPFTVLPILCAAVAAAQTPGALPPRIAALTPQGAAIKSGNFTGTPATAVASFVAEKSIGVGRSVEYRLDIKAFDNSSPTWRMRESAYRKQMEDRIASHRGSLAPETANQGLWTADPVKETKNGWGTGLTQRLLHHPPQASEYVDYRCAYYGMIGGITFELFVAGVPDGPGEADRWAQTVADAVSKLSVSNIGDK